LKITNSVTLSTLRGLVTRPTACYRVETVVAQTAQNKDKAPPHGTIVATSRLGS
jgi:hypothetical protein